MHIQFSDNIDILLYDKWIIKERHIISTIDYKKTVNEVFNPIFLLYKIYEFIIENDICKDIINILILNIDLFYKINQKIDIIDSELIDKNKYLIDNFNTLIQSLNNYVNLNDNKCINPAIINKLKDYIIELEISGLLTIQAYCKKKL